MAKETAKDQGVPEEYLNEDGNFKIGMDARYKSDLIHAALGLENPNAKMTFKPADAEKRLEQRNWTGFLDRKKEIIAEKERKAEKAAAEKAEREKERAAEKEKKAAEKKAKAEEKKSTASAVKAEEKAHAEAMKAEKAARSAGTAA